MSVIRKADAWRFDPPVPVMAGAGVVGPKEGEGPLGGEMDHICPSLHLERDSFEKAEQQMQEMAAELALRKAGLSAADIDLMLGGDLLNQIMPTCLTARKLARPFCGMFTACATSAQALSLASLAVSSGAVLHALVTAGSHTCTAERQFRYPNEYGSQKPPYSQQTATAAGALVIGGSRDTGVCITAATVGRVVDAKVTDPFQLSAAMAPAFADTLRRHLDAMGRTPGDYDLILSGDLGRHGVLLARDLLQRDGIDLSAERHRDCGLLLFGDTDSVFAGGSGAGCSASVVFGPMVEALRQGKYRRILLVATGALLSPQSNQQGESIPGIAHAVELEGGAANG